MIAPKRISAPISYFGAKGTLTPWLLSRFPRHDKYLEPFCGSAAVLLAKTRSPVEIISDTEPYLVNFLTQLRENWRLLKALCQNDAGAHFFQYARRCISHTSDPMESARMFFTINRQAYRQLPRTPTWDDIRAAARMRTGLASFRSASERLAGVEIHRSHYTAIMLQYDAPTAFAYLDPPYPFGVRTGNNDEYRNDMGQPEKHLRLLRFIKTLSMQVMISSYPNSVYDRELKGWRTDETRTVARSARAQWKEHRTEKVWMNY